MSSESKTFVVFGATGAQGGGVVRGLVAKGGCTVRAVTRNPDSEKAKALPEGVEVVKANMDDAESLAAVLAGADGAFLVTDTWGNLAALGSIEAAVEAELKQGKAVVDAAAAAGLPHLVYSGLENVKAITEGEELSYTVPHFDSKAEILEYAQGKLPAVTNAQYSFYTENFTSFFKPQVGEDGKLMFGFPMKDIPMGVVSTEDAGHAVATMLVEGASVHGGKTYGLANELSPIGDYAAAMSRVLGREVVYNDVPMEAFRGMAGTEMANMFQWYHDSRCVRDVEATRALYPGLRSFEQWLTDNKEAFSDL